MQNDQNLNVSNNKAQNTCANKNERAEKAATLKKRKAHEDFKRKYFDYYDDVKTSIKQDW